MNELPLMPRPAEIRHGAAIRPTTAANTVVGDASARLRRAVTWLPPMGLRIRFHIEARTTSVPALADRYHYRLSFADATGNGAGVSGVEVEAATDWGALAALSTLTQLSAAESLAIAEVRDAPRFPWRGLMIDCVRHFITLATLKRTLDAMWFYKLNVLHLHLTDDQGFRFRSAAYPELASEEAYSPAELRDLVAYAADRGIRVVPELDMPGHTASWLAVHPEWGKHGTVAATGSKRFGVHRECLDPANAEALTAVRTLLAEVAAIFADEFVHFGGDEAVGLSAQEQVAFHQAVVAELAALGKRAIGWDECLHPGLPGGTTVQAWRGANARDAVIEAGFDCVVSAPYYLDLFYPASTHYAYDPAGDLGAADRTALADPRLHHVREGVRSMANLGRFPEIPSRTAGRVLGGEACLWSELVTDELLPTRLWSRMPVIAERFWSVFRTEGDDPYPRMAASRRTLARLGVVPPDRAAIDEYPDLAPLIEMLEPVKWYRRLLGEAVYKGRVEGGGAAASELRPYDVTTPLNRIVDRIPPESLAARHAAADLTAGADMSRWIAGWRQQRTALAKHPELANELSAPAKALATIADIVAGSANSDKSPEADVAALAGPFGEYLLPIAYAVAKRR